MKTCIKYWGGKQQLSKKIIDLIPKHHCYCEPFFGGGAVFFAKPPSKTEVINDLNDNMVNFYKVLKTDFDKLKKEIDITAYSESEYRKAKRIWNEGDEDNIIRAWSVFVLSHQSFRGKLGNSWAFLDTKSEALRFNNMKNIFDYRYVTRIENTQIFCRDALRLIPNTDSEDTFFFIDPPYYNSNCGHYKGYTLTDFENLLKVLSTIKGKFLLSSYPSDILKEYTAKNSWTTINNEMHLSASPKRGASKVEVFTMNYNAIDTEELVLI